VNGYKEIFLRTKSKNGNAFLVKSHKALKALYAYSAQQATAPGEHSCDLCSARIQWPTPAY
jgi:hypothetical protein